jgi:hypothetical protein
MKFELNESVRVISTGKVGVVNQTKHERFVQLGKLVDEKKYYVNFGSFFNWYKESELGYVYKDDPTFDIGLLGLLIDVYLIEKNFDAVQKLYDQQQLLLIKKGNVKRN